MSVIAYKVTKTEWVTRSYTNHDRIDSRKVTCWEAQVDGRIVADGCATKKEALAIAARIIARVL